MAIAVEIGWGRICERGYRTPKRHWLPSVQTTQLGRPAKRRRTRNAPSGIEPGDMIYVADSKSDKPRNPGWHEGIRISAEDNTVTAFIPIRKPTKPSPDPYRAPTTNRA
jgi:hypothetical protein